MPSHVPLALAILSLATLSCARGLDRDLIGWSEQSSTTRSGVANTGDVPLMRSGGATTHAPVGVVSNSSRPHGMEVLSWDPRIFLFRGLLTDEECDHMVNKAVPRMARSGVVEDGGGDAISDIRTSDGMFFDRQEDVVISEIERKLSEWTLIPLGHGEGFQVLRYQKKQEYKPHFDYFFHEGGVDNGGNRLATVLMYLTDVEEGGETIFPNVPKPPTQTEANGYSKCAMGGLAVKPRKGDAVVFWSLRTEGTLDKGSLHGSCPVISGVKFAATKWYHVAHYALGRERAKKVQHVVFKPPPAPAPPGCKDSRKDCEGWAEGGECDANPGFMVGTAERPGDCLLSCGRCDLMPVSLSRKTLGL